MLAKRVVVALDIKDGRVVKGIRFSNLRDAGDPVELALRYEQEGADEIVFLDISASGDNRRTAIDLAEKVSRVLFIPFTVGGGISSLEEAKGIIRNGADKIFVNTQAILNRNLVKDLAGTIGTSNTVVAIDCKYNGEMYEVYSHGGSRATGLDAVEWAMESERSGAGELLVTSMDRDGTGTGFDTTLLKKLTSSVNIPVIASGGAGTVNHFRQAFQAGADAALGASVFHYGKFSVGELKARLREDGFNVRF